MQKILNRSFLNERFPDLINRNQIYIVREGITDIEPGTFDNLPELTYIYIKHNFISNIKASTFANLLNLQEINLSENQISEIELGAFQNLPNLRYIVLNGNKLVKIPSFNNLNMLSHISLARNEIVNISPRTLNLPSLITIDLECNLITNIESFNNLPLLRGIFLYNNFVSLPFVNMPNNINYNLNNLDNNQTFLNIIRNSPMYQTYLENNPNFNINSIYEIINNYNNFKIIHEIFSQQTSFYNLFANNFIFENMAKRIQLMLIYIFNDGLKNINDEEKQRMLQTIKYESKNELKEHIRNLNSVKATSKKQINKILPSDVRNESISYLGGKINDKYKYLKYKNKYLQIKKLNYNL